MPDSPHDFGGFGTSIGAESAQGLLSLLANHLELVRQAATRLTALRASAGDLAGVDGPSASAAAVEQVRHDTLLQNAQALGDQTDELFQHVETVQNAFVATAHNITSAATDLQQQLRAHHDQLMEQLTQLAQGGETGSSAAREGTESLAEVLGQTHESAQQARESLATRTNSLRGALTQLRSLVQERIEQTEGAFSDLFGTARRNGTDAQSLLGQLSQNAGQRLLQLFVTDASPPIQNGAGSLLTALDGVNDRADRGARDVDGQGGEVMQSMQAVVSIVEGVKPLLEMVRTLL